MVFKLKKQLKIDIFVFATRKEKCYNRRVPLMNGV